MSFFSHFKRLPDDPIFSLSAICNADPRENKINLGVGIYRNSEGLAKTLKAARKAEALLYDERIPKSYLPIKGDPEFIQPATELIFGKERTQTLSPLLISMQTLGGSGALRIGGELLAKQVGSGQVFVSDPTWPNHKLIFSRCGLTIRPYSYYNAKENSLNFEAMRASFESMPEGSVVILHACCHNPTGVDPSKEEWTELSTLLNEKKLIPFFDFAYQGFKESLEEDAWAIRHFADAGHEMLVAHSFSKNFGLYGERIGTLSILTQEKDNQERINSQCKQLIRGNYSNPPRHGAGIIKTVLSDETLKKEWIGELTLMRERMQEMRLALAAGLQAKAQGHNFNAIKEQCGMFSFIGLDETQVQLLVQEHALYLPKSGRINMAALNHKNLQAVIEAIVAVLS